MLDPKLEKALNHQINLEYAAAYEYLAMAAHFDAKNLEGFSKWMLAQHVEEMAHAMRLYRYVLDRGGRVELGAIHKPQMDFDSIRAVFDHALEQEKSNTKSINELYGLAKSIDDYATISHLQWFLDEQVEEEKTFDEAIGLIEMAGKDPSALLTLNDRFGRRQTGGNGINQASSAN